MLRGTMNLNCPCFAMAMVVSPVQQPRRSGPSMRVTLQHRPSGTCWGMHDGSTATGLCQKKHTWRWRGEGAVVLHMAMYDMAGRSKIGLWHAAVSHVHVDS